jgi:CRISPR/Cas system CSM-associated protein Csm2 small subunit
MDVISKQIGERNDLEEAINLLSEKQAAILNEISEYSKILEQTKTTSDKITNFIGEQNNQILKLISADYKQI